MGQLLAGVGGLLLLIDTWLPWYRFSFPAAALDRVHAFATSLGGPLGGLVQQGASILHAAGPVDLSAHDVFHAIDVELVFLGIAALVVVLGSLTRDTPLFTNGDGGPLAVLGAAACALVLYRILKPPEPSALLTARYGAYLALACGAAVLVGGLLMRGEAPPAPAPARELPDFSSASW